MRTLDHAISRGDDTVLSLAIPLTLCVAFCDDDPKATLRSALEQLESAPGYGFEMTSDHHGGLGGAGGGRTGRPRGAVVGCVEKGRPLQLTYESIELYRSSSGQAYRTDDDAWEMIGERPPPRGRAALSTLTNLLPPHELLAVSLENALDVTETTSATTGGTKWRVELGPDATRTVAGEFVRERRGAPLVAGSQPTRLAAVAVIRADASGVSELDVTLTVTRLAGLREVQQRRNVTYTLRPRADAPPAVPAEVREFLGLEPATPNENESEAPAASGGEPKESGR